MPRRILPVSIRAQVLTALQQYTQKELAARLGVSDRTIRRWKRGETEPLNPFSRLALADEYKAERARIKRINRKRAAPYTPPDVEVPLLGERRDLNLYDIHGKRTGQTYKSDWVNYAVPGLDVTEIFEVLRGLRNRGATVQVIFRVKHYPEGNRRVPAGTHWASSVFSLGGKTDVELWEGFHGFNGLSHYVTAGQLHRLLYVAVLER